MNPEAYKEWIKMFKDDFSKIWQSERKEMQKISILLCALHNELKSIQTNVEVQVSNLKQQLKNRDDLEKKVKSLSPLVTKKKSPNTFNKENDNEKESRLKHPNDLVAKKTDTGKESPDLFRNIDLNTHCSSSTDLSVIDLSISEDDAVKSDGSPTIKKRRKRCRVFPNYPNEMITENNFNPATPLNQIRESVKTNIFKTPVAKSDHDISVIDCTPEVVSKRSKVSSRIGDFMSRKKMRNRKNNNSTLTQMFRRVSERQRERHDTTDNDADSDETFFDDNVHETKLGITDLIHYINKDNSTNQDNNTGQVISIREQELETSSQDVDEFSKGAIFSEEDIQTSSEKSKPVTPEMEPVVRGKARKQLHGWSCQQCKNFYGQMKLSPKELQKKMDECSRHRFKYRPPEETMTGFWDLSIPPENVN